MVKINPVLNKLAVVSSLPYQQIIACFFVCNLPVQPATTFQEIHVLKIDFNSHGEIKNMNNVYRDACGHHSAYITVGCLVAL